MHGKMLLTISLRHWLKHTSPQSINPLAISKQFHCGSIIQYPRKLRSLYVQNSPDIADNAMELVDETKQRESAAELVDETKRRESAAELIQQKMQTINVSGLRPSLPVKSFSLAPYINESHTLKTLVEMGIDLAKTEKNHNLANHLLRADFEKDIKPFILFLHDIGLEGDEIVSSLSEQPELLMEHLDDLNARVNYLRSKKFSKTAISTIVKKKPAFLCVPTIEVDSQLGFLQRKFSLAGNEVRKVITTYPKIIFRGKQRIEELMLVMTGFMGFTNEDVKAMLITYPRVFMSERHGVTRRLDYLQKHMGLELADIVNYPNILRFKVNKIKERHRFLKHLERDQFDCKLPNYVSLETLVKGTDMEFCDNVAKVPVQEFNDFQKSL